MNDFFGEEGTGIPNDWKGIIICVFIENNCFRAIKIWINSSTKLYSCPLGLVFRGVLNNG